MKPIVELTDIHKYYGEGELAERLHVLKGITLQIMEGEFTALTGQSGSGKSTLLNLLGCLDTPSSGAYMLNGTDVSKMDDDDLSGIRSRLLGFIFQSFNLINQLDVVENVELPLFYQNVSAAERRERAGSMLERVGLSHRLGHFPPQLSGGERQRVAIARALVTNPVVLLADEPTGNLDSKTGEEIMALLHSLHGDGATIIMVTHDPEIARSLPRTVHMKDGVLV